MNPPPVDAFRELFLKEFEAEAATIEATDAIPEHLIERAAETGLFRLTPPRDHGGWELSLPDLVPYLEVAGMGPGCGRMLAHVSNAMWRPIARFGTPKQQELVTDMAAGEILVAFALTEKEGGTGRDLHSRARLSGDEWEVNGEKHLITFSDRAGYFILTVASDDRGAADSLTTFLVPRDADGLEIDASQHTMGLSGTGHAFLRFPALRVPDSWRLGEVGQGLEISLSLLDYSRISLAACMVGTAQRALEEALAYAKSRVTFGRPIAQRQAVQVHLADMGVDIAAARQLVRAAAKQFDSGVDARQISSMAKLYSHEMVGRVTDLALRVHGGFGYTKAAAVERLYRDARGYWFEEGTGEIQRLVIARGLLESG